MSNPNIFIVGFGSIGQRHYHLLSERLPDANIYIVHHSQTTNSHRVDSNVKQHFYSYEDAIEACSNGSSTQQSSSRGGTVRVDYVFICNPSTFHLDIAWKFASFHPKGIFIEKPVQSVYSNAVIDFYQYCNYNHIYVQIGYMLRFSKTLLHLQNVIKHSELGEILSVQVNFGDYLPRWRHSLNTDYSRQVSAQAALGGGVALEISHEFDYLEMLFGECDVKYSTVGKKSKLNIDVEDCIDLILTPLTSMNKKFVINVHIDMFDCQPHRTLRIVGEKGTMIWQNAKSNSVVDGFVLKHYSFDKETLQAVENTIMTDPDRNQLMKDQLDYFLNHSSQNESRSLTPINGIFALRIASFIKQ